VERERRRFLVIAGLDPAIQSSPALDRRIKSGDDKEKIDGTIEFVASPTAASPSKGEEKKSDQIEKCGFEYRNRNTRMKP